MRNIRMISMLFLWSYMLWLGSEHIAVSSFSPPTQVTVKMYRLISPSGAKFQPEELCSSTHTTFGCTAFVGDVNHPYPYGAVNPVTIPIETDYLLDVLPQEMGTYYHPLALQAQAIAARTYAYWHRENGFPIVNNSTSYQAFIPYKFENLPTATFPDNTNNPCASSNLNAHQQIVCGAVASQRYISYNGDLPAFTEFTADALNATVSNPTDRAGNPSPYLLGVEEPISTTCDANVDGHGHGLSQEGASRWGQGQPVFQWGRGQSVLECSLDAGRADSGPLLHRCPHS